MPVIYSPLSDSELDSICLSLVNRDLPYFSAFHEAFLLLYLTGCRVEEIFDISRWERLSDYEMRFLPQKDNYHRYVTLDYRCDSFIAAVVGRYKPFGGLSAYQLNRVFYNFSEYSNFRVGSKPVSLYLFRYNFIRKLHADGLNINQIADKMGYTSTAVVGGYLTAEIEKGFFLDTDDFINIDGTYWSKKFLSWNDGGSDIQIRAPFSDGVSYFYYNYTSVGRYLLNNTSFRLPTQADFYQLIQFCYDSGFSGGRSLLVPSLVYWSAVTPYMLNAFEFGLVGAGMVTTTLNLQYLNRCYILMTRSSSPALSACYFGITSTSATFVHTNTPFFYSVRLILNV